MQHSMPAGSVAWATASIGGRSGRAKERRLGLRAGISFNRAVGRRAIARAPHGGWRGTGWLPASESCRRGSRSGLVRPAVTIHWAAAGRPHADRRSALAPAPWRG